MIAIVSRDGVALAEAVGADVIATPDMPETAGEWNFIGPLETWRDHLSGPAAAHVVVAPWSPQRRGGELLEDDLATWTNRFERPLAVWTAALGAAARRCADGGVIVAVVEKPAPLDCAGWAAETALADAVEALIRSLARSEGPRGVRCNAVTTPARLTTPPVVAPAPSLSSFPGRIDREVVGAVRMLLSDDAVGITGVVLDANCGRSWR